MERSLPLPRHEEHHSEGSPAPGTAIDGEGSLGSLEIYNYCRQFDNFITWFDFCETQHSSLDEWPLIHFEIDYVMLIICLPCRPLSWN